MIKRITYLLLSLAFAGGMARAQTYDTTYVADQLLPMGLPNLHFTLLAGLPIDSITKEIKRTATCTMSNAHGSTWADAQLYVDTVTLKVRGNSSAQMPAKPYGMVTVSGTGSKKPVVIFNYPVNEDWVLRVGGGGFYDKSLLNDVLGDRVAACFDMPLPIHSIYVKVYINDTFQYIGTFSEKIEAGLGRIPGTVNTSATTAMCMERQPEFQMDVADVRIIDSIQGNAWSWKAPESDKVTVAQAAIGKTHIGRILASMLAASNTDTTYRTLIHVRNTAKRHAYERYVNNSEAGQASFYWQWQYGGLASPAPVWDNGYSFATWAANPYESKPGTFTNPDSFYFDKWNPEFKALLNDTTYARILKEEMMSALPRLNRLLSQIKPFAVWLESTGVVASHRAKWPQPLSDALFIPLANYQTEIDRRIAYLSRRTYYQTRFIYDPIAPRQVAVKRGGQTLKVRR